ncbi:hypothetical protein L596_024711 [Steinernema carpocapsae]|uniref:Uncharacterized protein n=1 Tax=Steinernema carpocapsae TaxID=34508 RepID=A0A4U5M5J3_STECR|nr:hypothetical protein L596_024711 [Steinernema carpocapsae]
MPLVTNPETNTENKSNIIAAALAHSHHPIQRHLLKVVPAALKCWRYSIKCMRSIGCLQNGFIVNHTCRRVDFLQMEFLMRSSVKLGSKNLKNDNIDLKK